MLRSARKLNITHCSIRHSVLQERVWFCTSSKWSSQDVRKTFVDYFIRKHSHQHVKSSAVAPLHDPTLLFTNAGMNQFKPVFTGELDNNSPLKDIKRVVNSQKCIRAGGKHNDLDDVGKDSYHHTFFEMLGTWSFGEYFKKEAIDWAYDLLVNVYKLPKEHLYVSYFAGNPAEGVPADEEARKHWLQYFPESRVLPFGQAENFWEMGDVGPCGPCSEIHYDRLGAHRVPGGPDPASLVNKDDPNVLEIWNLVFMQYFRDATGNLKTLPSNHIDTGMGLERLVSILQNKPSNYDTDLFVPLFDALHSNILRSDPQLMLEPYGYKYGSADAIGGYKDTAYRIVADHARACAFALADGVLPSSEGRGYVLRRIIRRALRYGVQNLGAKPGFFSELLPCLCNSSIGDEYPELRLQQAHMVAVVLEEEMSFARVLERGTKEFQLIVEELVNSVPVASVPDTLNIFPGDRAFYLHDSLGFPVDLTILMAEEAGLTVDMKAFNVAMENQRALSSSSGGSGKMSIKGSAASIEGTEESSVFSFKERIGLSTPNIGRLSDAGIPPTNDGLKYTWDRDQDSFSVREDQNVPIRSCAIVLKGGDVLLPSTFDETKDVLEGVVGTEHRGAGGSGVEVEFGLVLNGTCFYAEAGGQVSDRGLLLARNIDGSDNACAITVVDVQSFGPYILHQCNLRLPTVDDVQKLFEGMLNSAEPRALTLQVDYVHRRNVATNHTMTHVLNHALTNVLKGCVSAGGSINQKGSLVTDSKLRFDYSINKQPSLQQVHEVEQFVNNVVQANLPVSVEQMPLQKALALDNVRAMFGETYPDPVRVVSITENGEHDKHLPCRSVELCGGTHLTSTADAGAFIIVEEESVAKGVRRIVAVTREAALQASANKTEILAQLTVLRDLVMRHDSATKGGTDGTDINSGELRVHTEEQIKTVRAALSISDASIGLLPHVFRNESRQECDSLARSFGTAVSRHNISRLDLIIGRVIEAPSISVASFVEDNNIVSCSRMVADDNIAATLVIMNCLPSTDSASIKHVTDKLSKQFLQISDPSALLLVVLESSGRGGHGDLVYKKANLIVVTSKSAQKSKSLDANILLKKLLDSCEPLGLVGRGGGKAGFAQGSIQLDRNESGDNSNASESALSVSIKDVLGNLIAASSSFH